MLESAKQISCARRSGAGARVCARVCANTATPPASTTACVCRLVPAAIVANTRTAHSATCPRSRRRKNERQRQNKDKQRD
eukprot:1177404-Prorocentrum_minimum.AAC.2